ncbi:YhdP family protein [Chitinimonas lacunae]|uniref:YhdP family protein n=1 Tax=Chitinimonas lacunae TaxID=1963018 RepID=A0ABV8MNX8_9NEIS
MSQSPPYRLVKRLRVLTRYSLRVLHWHSRALIWLALTVVLGIAGCGAWINWWLFPNLDRYRHVVETRLSDAIGRPVQIGRLDGGWSNLKPSLTLRNFSLLGDDGRPAVTLPQAEATLAWWPIIIGDLRFDALTVVSPTLELTRERDGSIRLAGLRLDQGPSDGTLANWLLRQHDLAIRNGSVIWVDHLRGAPPLVLEQVDLSVENLLFGRHRFTVLAKPPAALAAPVRVEGSWRGDDVNQAGQWRGDLRLLLDDVDLAAWGRWLPYPIKVKHGSGKLHLTLRFADGLPRDVEAKLDIRAARLLLAEGLADLDVDTLVTTARWQDRDGRRELTLAPLTLAAEGGRVLAGSEAKVVLEREGGGSVELDGLTLPSLAGLPAALPLPREIRHALAGLKPAGRIDKVRGSWAGDWREPSRYEGQVTFQGIGLTAPPPWPTMGPLDGELQLSEQGGKLAVQSSSFTLAAGQLFEKPLRFDRLGLKADWTRSGRALTVRVGEFEAGNADLDANARAVWRWNGSGPGELDLEAATPRVVATKVVDYLPLVVGDDTRAWLKQAILAGEATDGRFVLKGPLAAFPFDRDRRGIWRVNAKVRNARLHYADGWPDVENISADLLFERARMQIDARAGRILGAQVEQARATLEDLAHDDLLTIEGKAAGPTGEFFQFINRSPLDQLLEGIGRSAVSAGDGRLGLRLAIPLSQAENTRVEGHYSFGGNRLRLTEAMPELTGLDGTLHFSERGAEAQGMRAHALGGPLSFDMATDSAGQVKVAISGQADARVAAQYYGVPQAGQLQGSTDYRAELRLPPQGGWQLALEAPLKQVSSGLPAPLDLAAGEAGPLRMALEIDERSERWRVALGERIGAEVRRVANGPNWKLDRAEIRFGEGKPSLARPGIWLSGTLPELDLDAWLALAGEGGSGGGAAAFAGADLRIGRLLFGSHRLDEVKAQVQAQEEGWQIDLASRQASGNARWLPQGRGRLNARMSRLALPLPQRDVGVDEAAAADEWKRWPAVDAQVEEFQYRDHPLGRIDLRARPLTEGWAIEHFAIRNSDGRLTLDGTWRPTVGDTRMNIDIESDNLGKLLGRFGYPETVRRGSGRLGGEVSWRGSPLSPQFLTMNGHLKLVVESGQFAKVDPGVGRLLGVLSLQALPRRISLDFRDIFSEGFAFDRIEGDSKIVAGILSTDNLTIVGPAAQILFRGQTDLEAETQVLRVRIVPTIGDSIAVTAGVALANPALGVGAFLLQRALKDPLGQLIAYEYDISGRWDDPKIERVGSLFPTAAK